MLVHTWPLFIAFSAEKRKNSLSSRFSVALTDISLITIGLFQYSLFFYARENTKPALPKKKRARTRFRHMENEFSRAKLHSRAPRSVRVSLFYSQKQNQTHANSASSDEKSLRELTFCLSVKEKKKMKTRNQNRRSKSTLKNQRATRKSAQKTYLSACSASFALNTRSSRSILTLCDAFVCIFR